MWFPQSEDVNLQAFITGFFLPFLAAAAGFAISVVRNLLKKIEDDRLN
jgi:hypothetical protein